MSGSVNAWLIRIDSGLRPKARAKSLTISILLTIILGLESLLCPYGVYVVVE